jgi:hypothetical protein
MGYRAPERRRLTAPPTFGNSRSSWSAKPPRPSRQRLRERRPKPNRISCASAPNGSASSSAWCRKRHRGRSVALMSRRAFERSAVLFATQTQRWHAGRKPLAHCHGGDGYRYLDRVNKDRTSAAVSAKRTHFSIFWRHRVHRRERRRTGCQAPQAGASKTNQVRFAARDPTVACPTDAVAPSSPRSLDVPLALLDRHQQS